MPEPTSERGRQRRRRFSWRRLVYRYRKLGLWNRIGLWGAVSSLLAIPLAIVLHFLGPDPQAPRGTDRAIDVAPYRLAVEGDYVEAWSRLGKVLWSHEARGPVLAAVLLDAEARNEVVSVISVASVAGEAGSLVGLGEDGRKLWDLDLGRQANYLGGTSGVMQANKLVVSDHLGSPRVLALGMDAQAWFPARVYAVDPGGRLLGSYWHPGHLHHAFLATETDDAEPRLVVAGLNNDLGAGFAGSGYLTGVAMLKAGDIDGEAPPRSGRLGFGSELWYGVLLPKGETIHRLEVVDRDGDGRRELSLWTRSGHVFYLDFEGRVRSIGRSDGALGAPEFRLVEMRSEGEG